MNYKKSFLCLYLMVKNNKNIYKVKSIIAGLRTINL